VHSCYEAGRDGWWLHRWLVDHGVHNIVVESASAEVNRRLRRAKNGRPDADKLLSMRRRYVGGEYARRAREPHSLAEDGRESQLT
jgi:transposase